MSLKSQVADKEVDNQDADYGNGASPSNPVPAPSHEPAPEVDFFDKVVGVTDQLGVVFQSFTIFIVHVVHNSEVLLIGLKKGLVEPVLDDIDSIYAPLSSLLTLHRSSGVDVADDDLTGRWVKGIEVPTQTLDHWDSGDVALRL